MIVWGRLSARASAIVLCRAALSRPTSKHTHMRAAAAQAAVQRPPGPRPQVIIVTGPTAVGKTAASLELAHAVDAEIISADSVQVYRGLDIGSAKVGAVTTPAFSDVAGGSCRRSPCSWPAWEAALQQRMRQKLQLVMLALQLLEHERQSVLHHLLDVAEPSDDFSAGQFFYEARRVTDEILQVWFCRQSLAACTRGTAQQDAELMNVYDS